MTFTEAIAYLKERILSETTSNFLPDSDYTNFLWEAAVSIAAEIGFPQQVFTEAIVAPANSVAADATVRFIVKNQVLWDEHPMLHKSYAAVKSFQLLSGIPGAYNFDPTKSTRLIQFGPTPTVDGTLSYEAVIQVHPTLPAGGDNIWGNLFPAHHEAVVFDAARRVFRKNRRFDYAQTYDQLAMERKARLQMELYETEGSKYDKNTSQVEMVTNDAR